MITGKILAKMSLNDLKYFVSNKNNYFSFYIENFFIQVDSFVILALLIDSLART